MRPTDLLSRNDAERSRVVDMSRRLRRVRGKAMALFVIAALIGVRTFGWTPLVPISAAVAATAAAQTRLRRHRRPELVLAAAWLLAQAMIAIAIFTASGPRLLMLSAFAFPMMLGSVVWPGRTVVVGTLVTTLAMVAVAFGTEADAVIDTPPVLFYPVVLVVCTALWGSAIRNADIESRTTAIVDSLTGALNRSALAARVAELTHRAEATGQQLAVIVGDVDHFKLINDRHGHAAGDIVLRTVVSRMREALQAFESPYRIGGDEFVVVMPGMDVDAAVKATEKIAGSVSRDHVAGEPVTMSFGVAASNPGEQVAWPTLFGSADRALLRAKAEGRGRVCTSVDDVEEAAAPTATATGWRADAAPVVESPMERATDRPLVDDLQRDQLIETHRRIDRVGHIGNLLVFVALVAAAPSYGWAPLVPVLAAAIVFQAIESNLDRFRRPTSALWVGWLLAVIGYSLAYLLAHPAPLPALPLLVLFVVGFSAVFPPRVLLIGSLVLGSFTVAVAFAIAPDRTVHDPAILAYSLALLGSVTLIGSVVGQSAVEHRGAAVVDPLTGMLNRTALDARAGALVHHTALTGQPLAVLVGDLDRFKSINDARGHAAGDAVLREVARRLGAHLRPFDSAYRIGGEEFVVLLPGIDVDDAIGVAERLADAIRSKPIDGFDVTISFGVAAIGDGQRRTFEQLFAEADEGLLEAKRAGRDRIRAARARLLQAA